MATTRQCSIDWCERPHLARGWCKQHYRRWQDHGDPQHTPTRDWYWTPGSTTQRCSECLTYKPLDPTHFRANRRYRSGYVGICIVCWQAYIKRRHGARDSTQQEQDRESRRRINAKIAFGLSYEDYDSLHANPRCRACGDLPQPGRRKHAIDHDHKTGRVRGLLCIGCNTALGGLKDDPARIMALLDYLIRTTT